MTVNGGGVGGLVPPDGGWGWMVTIGTFFSTMILSTQGPCFGILFGPRLRHLDAPPSLAAWLFNAQSMVWNLTGPWAGPLSSKFSYRSVAVMGALLCSVSIFLSATVTSPYLLLVTFSLLYGMGGGLNITCCYHLTAKYFQQRLGLANGIMVTGQSIGIIVLPQLASFLQEAFPFAWATAISGAITLHTVVGSLLFQPVEWHLRRAKVETEAPNEASEEAQPLAPRLAEVRVGLPRGASVPANLMMQPKEGVETHKRPRRVSERQVLEPPFVEPSSSINKLRAMSLGGSSLMGSALILPPPVEPTEPQAKSQQGGVFQQFWAHFNPSVLRDPMVMSVAIVNCITMVAAVNIFSALPYILHEAGYSLHQAATAMSVAAVADLMTRLTCTLTADLSCVKPRVLYAAGQLIFILAPQVLMMCVGQWWVVLGCAMCFGTALGVVYIMDVFIMVQLLGANKMQSALGMTQLLRSIAFISIGPIGGVIREVTGGYWATLSFYSCSAVLGLLVMVATALMLKPPQTSSKPTAT